MTAMKFLRVSLAVLLYIVGAQGLFGQGVHITKRADISPSTGTNHYSDVVAEGPRIDGKSYAYVSSWHNTSGVWIFDVTDPDAPIFLTKYAPSNSLNMQGIEVDKGLGYFGDDSGGGIHIVDLTNPAAPTLITRITSTQGGYNSVHDLTLDGNGHMFVPHYRVNDDVQIWNVSNPAAPYLQMTLQGTDTLSVHDVTVANNRLFMAGWGGQLDIWDISNLDTQPPTMLGSFVSGFHTQDVSLTPDGRFLACPRELLSGDVGIFDILDPANVQRVATITQPGWGINATSPSTSKIMGNLLFVAWYQSGLLVFDISTPSNPILVGNYDTWPGFSFGGVGGGDGDWGVWPFLGLDRVLVSDRTTGLYILDVSGWSSQPGIFSLNFSPSSVPGSTSAKGTVGLVGISPQNGMTVNVSSSDPSVNPALVSIPAGLHVARFSEGTNTVASSTTATVTATDGSFSTGTTLTVLPPQLASTSVSPNTFQGGLNATGRVTLTGSVANDTPVSLSVVSGGSAVSSMPTSVIVPAAFNSATWTIQTNQVTVSTPVKISATFNGLTKYGSFTVGPLTPSAVSFSPTSLSGGNTTTGKVSFLVPVNQDTVVTLAVVSGGTAVASMPTSVIVPASFNSATWTIQTNQVTGSTTVKISATLNGLTKYGSFTVRPLTPSALSFSPTSLSGGSTTTGKVSFLVPLSQDTVVTLAVVSGGTAVASMPTSVTVPAGSASATFLVNTQPVGATTTVNISATANGGIKSATFSVH